MHSSDDQDFNAKYEVHTIAEVIKEIRDEQVSLIRLCFSGNALYLEDYDLLIDA